MTRHTDTTGSSDEHHHVRKAAGEATAAHETGETPPREADDKPRVRTVGPTRRDKQLRERHERREHQKHETPDAIRRDIDDTRHQLDSTIDTLQLRLSPQYITQQTMDKIKHKSSQAGHGFTRTIRENPVPAVLTGVGIAWLLGASRHRSQTEEHIGYRDYPDRPPRTAEDAELRARHALYEAGMESQGSAYPRTSSQQVGQGEGKAHQMGEQAKAYGQQARDKAHEYGEQAKAYGQQARDKAHEYGEQAREKASEYGHRIADSTAHMRDRASEMGHHLREQASDAGDRIRAGSQHAKQSAYDLFEDHPLSVGLGVLAAGLALGLLLPGTRKENEAFGQQRDKLMEQAQAYGSDMAERGMVVAQRAGEAASEAASDAASEQGLTGGESETS